MTAIPSDTAAWFAAYPADKGEAGDAIDHAKRCPCALCVPDGQWLETINRAYRQTRGNVEPPQGGG